MPFRWLFTVCTREKSSVAAGRRSQSDTSIDVATIARECGRLMATAGGLLEAKKLVLGSDDGNVEGNRYASAFVYGLELVNLVVDAPSSQF